MTIVLLLREKTGKNQKKIALSRHRPVKALCKVPNLEEMLRWSTAKEENHVDINKLEKGKALTIQ